MAINPVISGGNYWPKQGVETRVRDLQEASVLAQDLPQPEESLDLQKACQEFESIFIHFLLKTMRESIPTGTLLDKAPGEDMYASLFDQELAKNIAQRGGIGISQMLLRELSSPNHIIKPLDTPLPCLIKPLGDKEQPGEGDSLSQAAVLPGPDLTPAIPSGDKPKETSDNYPIKTWLSNGVGRIEEKANETGKKYPGYVLNLNGELTSPFGLRKDPFNDKVCFHAGIDLAMAAGSEVRAAYSGKVIFSGWRGGYGNMVVLQHDNNYTTSYAHNAKNLVSEGDVIEGGQAIALAGDTGRATGPHLHFELRESGIPIDPAKVVDLET